MVRKKNSLIVRTMPYGTLALLNSINRLVINKAAKRLKAQG